MDKAIMSECYADTLLIESLVPTKKGYNHKHSCFSVEAEMKKGKLENHFAVGIVDNDKKQLSYLNEFEEVCKVEESLILWKHKQKSHFIIQVCPALEKWVMDICTTNGIEFQFNSLDEFKKHTKRASSIEDETLKKLFRQISKRDDIIAVKSLKHWISLLKEKNYRVDINELKNVGSA